MKSWMTKLNGAECKVMRLNDAPVDGKMADSAEKVVAMLRDQIPASLRYNQDAENFMVVFLNTRLRVISWEVVSNGTLDTLLVHPREVFKTAIVLGEAAIILAHNHPSGDPTPSEADIKVTRDLVRAGQLLKIEVLDHIVLGRDSVERPRGWMSLKELGYFYA